MNRGRKISVFLILISIFVISSCTVRSYKVVKPRLDQEESGNRGYLAGETPATTDDDRPTTRDTYVWEFEFGSEVMEKGTVSTKPETQESEYVVSEPSGISLEDDQFIETDLENDVVTYTDYKVEKDDTLQKISKKFYGTYRKWKKIYNANEDKIKDPNKIKPGIVIKIPQ